MIENTRYTLAISMLVLLSACASPSFNATILPQQNNTYTSIATASTQNVALENAVGKATEVCKEKKKNLIVLDRKEELKTDSGAQTTQITKLFAGTALDMDNSENNKVTLQFKCE